MARKHGTPLGSLRLLTYAIGLGVMGLASHAIFRSVPVFAYTYQCANGSTTTNPFGCETSDSYQSPTTTTSTTPNTTDTWTPASGYQQNLTSQITSTTAGFNSDATNEAGGYTYNGCAAYGEVTAYNTTSKQSYCSHTGCPAGEKQINNDGVCQGTGSDNAGTYAQWTFSACVNGHQTEYTHNVNSGAVVDSNTISCIANTASNPTSSPSHASTVHNTAAACSAPGASSHSQPAGSSFAPTGCAGSCTTSGCTGTGTESGIETDYTRICTTSYSCPGPTANTSCSTSSYSSSATQTSSTQCQEKEVLLDQCMPQEPGNREAEYCLTFNGGTTNCSAPFGVYDPTNCPIPVGVGSGS